jgi:hypothetical protein
MTLYYTNDSVKINLFSASLHRLLSEDPAHQIMGNLMPACPEEIAFPLTGVADIAVIP